MRKLLLYLPFVLLLLSACAGKKSKQFEFSGGTLKMSLDEYPTTFVPNEVIDTYSSKVLGQVFDGLVSVDSKDLKIQPRLAESWVELNEGTKYKFILRKNVLFHSAESFESESDRALTPEDVVFSVEKICKPNPDKQDRSAYFFAFNNLLKGADDFHNGKAKSISGLSISGDTVTFELLRRDHNFLFKLAHVSMAIESKKANELGLKSPVGTGPFQFSKQNSDEKIVLTKNHDFYLKDKDGNALPYLDSLLFVIEGRKLGQLGLFEDGQIDLIQELPASRITKMLEGNITAFNSVPPQLILENNALLESNYYFFNGRDERFKDTKVRQAFNYAINRKRIGIDVLKNQYFELGHYGVVPPIKKSIRGYDFDMIEENGYEFNIAKARKLFAEAGYPNGEGFGSVTIRYNINERNSSVADELAKQLNSVLNINVNIDGSSFEQLIDDYHDGNGSLYKLSWSADFPNPESFLKLFYVTQDSTKNAVKSWMGISNPLFNSLFEKGVESKKISEQLEYFSKAEKALLEDPPFIVLWYAGDFEIIQSYVRNFHFNPLGRLDFTRVYIKPWSEEEYQQFLAEN